MGLFDFLKKKDPKPTGVTSNIIEEKSVVITSDDKKTVENEKPKKEKPKYETVKVHGSSFLQDAYKQLKWTDNPDYDSKKNELIDDGLIGERVYKEYYSGDGNVELIDEPDNPEDPKAIAIFLDGVKIGYVAKGKTGHIRKLRKEDNIRKMDIEVWGGKYKFVSEYEDDDYKTKYDLEKDDVPYGAQITLYYKNVE